MAVKVAINGYGRIGRNMLRALYEGEHRSEIQIVAVNDLGDAKTNAHLTQYDTAHGQFPGAVGVDGRLARRQRRQDQGLRRARSVEAAVEGARRRRRARVHRPLHSKAKAGAHLKAGAKKVIISAPGEQGRRRARSSTASTTRRSRRVDTVISNASCTTNCLAPLAKVLHDKIGIVHGLMTTDPLVHERSGADRRVPQGPAPRALGDDVA